jgi:hypothetical protein
VSFSAPVSILGWIYDPDHSLPPGMYVDVPHLDCLLVAALITVEGLDQVILKPKKFDRVDGGALPAGQASGEGAHPRCAVRDDGLASQACGARTSATRDCHAGRGRGIAREKWRKMVQ